MYVIYINQPTIFSVCIILFDVSYPLMVRQSCKKNKMPTKNDRVPKTIALILISSGTYSTE